MQVPLDAPTRRAPGRRESRRRTLAALAIFVTALSVRLVFLVQIEAYPKFEYVRNRLDDQVVFDYWAKSIVRGETPDFSATGHEFAHWAAAKPGVHPQAPLYPYFVSTIYRLGGIEYDAVRLVQMLLGSLAAVLVYLIALRYLEPAFALVAALAAAFYGPFVFYEATFMRAGVAVFVVALCLYLLQRASEAESPRAVGSWSLSAGLSLGAAVLLRPNFLLFALPAIAWLYLARAPRYINAVPRLAAGMALVGLVAPLLPVVVGNTLRSGDAAFISSNGPYIFFIGNVHDAPGYTAGVSPYYREIKASRPPESIDLFAETVRDIRAHPVEYARLQVRKLGYFFTPEELPNNLSYSMAKKTNPALSRAFLEFHMILPLALIGLMTSFWARKDFSLLYLFGACFVVATVLFYVLSRLRQPILIPMVIFAALALQLGWKALERRRYARVAAGAIFVVGASLYLAPHPARHRDSDYEMAGAAYFSWAEEAETSMRLEAARQAYAHAVVLNPDHDRALVRLLSIAPAGSAEAAPDTGEEARRLVEQGEYDAARRLLESLAHAHPEASTPHQYLANVAYLQGDLLAALQHLERAVELDPGEPLLRENLKVLRRQIAIYPH